MPAPYRWAILIPALLATGCGFVPVSRFNECQNLARGLQSEVAHLKSVELGLRSRNADLARREATADLQNRTQAERVRELERAVLTYQSERDEMAKAFDELRAEWERTASAAPVPRMTSRPAPGSDGFAAKPDDEVKPTAAEAP